MLRISALAAACGLVFLAASALPWGMAGDNGAPMVAAGDAAYGKALFQAKGCATCHQHSAIAGSRTYFGGPVGTPPDLSNYTADPAYLRSWLRDPKAVKPTTTMPNLGLGDDEIASLIAFLKSSAAPAR